MGIFSRRDKDGYYRKGYWKGYDEKGYDEYGFDKNGIHKVTGTKLDEDGYIQEGFNVLDPVNVINRITEQNLTNLESPDMGKLSIPKTAFIESLLQ